MPTLKVWDGTQFHEIKGDKGDPGEVTTAEMEDRVTPIEGSVSALDARVVDTEVETGRLATQRYDTRAFASIQDAIDTAHAAGGGEVFVGDAIPDGLDIVLKDGVYLNGRGIGNTVLNINTITGAGSTTQLPALSANVGRHARSLTFSSAPDVQSGDVIILTDPTDFSFSSARFYYRAGEFVRVSRVDGNTVHLTKPVYGAYSAASIDLYRMNPIRCGVSNMTINCTANQSGIKVSFGTDLRFENLDMSGSYVTHLSLSRCYNVDIDHVKAFDATPLTGSHGHYGITIANSQRVRLNNVDLETTRHGLTLTGDGLAGEIAKVPNRDIQVNDSYINGLSEVLGVCGCNVHGNAEYVSFDNVMMPSGINPAGDYITIRNSEIHTAPWGTALSCMEMLGANLTIENNIFRATADHDGNRGMVFVFFPETTTRDYSHTRIIDNMFDLGPYVREGTPSSATALYILTTATSGATWRHLEIEGNTFFSRAGSLTNGIGARIRNDAGNDQWREITVTDNKGNLRIEASESQTLMFFTGHGSALPTFAAQRGSMYRRRANAGSSTGKLYMNENGDTTWTAK